MVSSNRRIVSREMDAIPVQCTESPPDQKILPNNAIWHSTGARLALTEEGLDILGVLFLPLPTVGL